MSETQKIWPARSAALGPDRIKKPSSSDRSLAESIETHSIDEEHDLSDSSLGSLKPLNGGHVHLDVLVSIGTGEQQRIDNYPSAFEVGGLKEAYLSFIKAMDTEASWSEFKAKTIYDTRCHYRLNVPITGRYVRLDDWTQMQRLEDSVHECYSMSMDRLNVVQDVASRLTASLLFFEPATPSTSLLQPRDRFHRIQGHIWCRLARDTFSLKALVERISGFWIQEDNPRIGPSPSVPVTLKDDWRSEIRTEGQHLALPVTLKTTEPESVISLGVSLRDANVPEDPSGVKYRVRKFPISGFPTGFKDLEAKVTAQ